MDYVSLRTPAEPAVPDTVAQIDQALIELRGQRVLLDRDLATIYGVTVKRLHERVRRNPERFPPDLLFRLTTEEAAGRAVSARGGGGNACAFSESGALMASFVIDSPRAVEMSVYLIQSYVTSRALEAQERQRIRALERQLPKGLDEHDEALAAILLVIGALSDSTPPQSH